MRTLIFLIGMLIISGCGKAPQAASAEEIQKKKEASFSCWLSGGRSHTLELPNDCNSEATFCVIDQDALDVDQKKIEKDSCEYKALTVMGAFSTYSYPSW